MMMWFLRMCCSAPICLGTATVLALTGAPLAVADSLGGTCADVLWMKLSTDAATGQGLVCAGAYPAKSLTWQAVGQPPATAFVNLPVVGAVGSPCNAPPMSTLAQSSDGYVVWCRYDGRALLPGKQKVAVSNPAWSLYSP